MIEDLDYAQYLAKGVCDLHPTDPAPHLRAFQITGLVTDGLLEEISLLLLDPEMSLLAQGRLLALHEHVSDLLTY